MGKGLQDLINTKVAETPPFGVDLQPLGSGGSIVGVCGELDMLTVPVLRETLDQVIDSGAKRLLLDLTQVSFVDSVSLAAIVNARRRLGADARLGVIIEEGSYAMLIFEIGGLDSIVELFHTRDHAVAQFTA